MNIHEMTREDFETLPHRRWDETTECHSLVILPTKDLHTSGCRCMDFAAVVGDEAKCLLSGCSDIICIDGIGGFGKDWVERYSDIPEAVPPAGWTIDCLPKSGLLRIRPASGRMTCGPALSTFEIFSVRRDAR